MAINFKGLSRRGVLTRGRWVLDKAACASRSVSAFIVLAAVSGFFSACNNSDRETWKVLLPSIPSNVSLEREGETAVSYILGQTHEPLFSRTDGQNFTSKLLTFWSRGITYTEFRFCPNTALQFDATRDFSSEYFRTYLSDTTKKYTSVFKLKAEGVCTAVVFPEPKVGYLDFLSRYDNSPSVLDSNGYPVGLGQFKIEKLSSERAVLMRKQPVFHGYNRIVFQVYNGPDDPKLQDKSISDFNRIPPHQQPEWIKKEYLGFSNLELTAVAVGINHPQKQVRQLLYNCIDTHDFRSAFVPKKKDFLDIATVLPVGVTGGTGGRPAQTCTGLRGLDVGPVILANPKKDNQSQLAEFALAFKKKTGLKIIVRNFAPQEMNPMLYETNRRRPYTLVVLAVGATRSDASEFVKLYAGKPLALDFVERGIKEKFSKIETTDGVADKSELVRDLAEVIKANYLALPLYQSVSTRYYPRSVKNLMVGDGFEEYPRVADFRW